MLRARGDCWSNGWRVALLSNPAVVNGGRSGYNTVAIRLGTFEGGSGITGGASLRDCSLPTKVAFDVGVIREWWFEYGWWESMRLFIFVPPAGVPPDTWPSRDKKLPWSWSKESKRFKTCSFKSAGLHSLASCAFRTSLSQLEISSSPIEGSILLWGSEVGGEYLSGPLVSEIRLRWSIGRWPLLH